jgi:hypothetical protein
MPNPLSSLATVEHNLIGAINAASDHLDQLGTSAVSTAMDRLKASADSAKARLASTLIDLDNTVGGVVEAFASATASVLGRLMLNTVPLGSVPTVPAPIPEPATVVMTATHEPASTTTTMTVVPSSQDPRQTAPAIEPTREPVATAIEAQEASQSHEPLVAVAACSPVETADQTMSKRKPRGRKADGGSIAGNGS